MNHAALSPTDRAALRDEAFRRAHELRREAIVQAWDALFRVLVPITRRVRAALA